MTWVIYGAIVVALSLLAFWVSQRPSTRTRFKEYVHDSGRAHESLLSQSLNGVLWSKAPIPNPFHQCWVQTQYFSRSSTQMGRCSCGAFTRDRGKTWTGRNSRRRGLHAHRP